MRDEDVGGADGAEVAGDFAHEIADDAAGDVVDIEGALAEVGVVYLGEGLGVAIGDLGEDVLDVEAIALEGAEDFIDEGAIFDDEEVGIEDGGIVGADGDGDFLLKLEDLLAGGEESAFEALDLVWDVIFRDAMVRGLLVVRAMVEDGAAGDAGGGGDAVEAELGRWGFGGGAHLGREARGQKPEARSQKPESRGQKPVIRCQ